MSFFNRCEVAGAEGRINLSVPVVGGRDVKGALREVKIDYRSDWRRQHWRTIFSCYNRSPFFEFYRDELESLYQEQHEYLSAWNISCLKWLVQKLEIATLISVIDEMQSLVGREVDVDLRGRFTPRNREETAIPALRYRQVFEERTGFIPNLSSLDLLFCAGPKALRNV